MEKEENRGGKSQLLSFTQMARELGGLEKQRRKKQNRFIIKMAAGILCLTGVVTMVILWSMPHGKGISAEQAASALQQKPILVVTPTPEPTVGPASTSEQTSKPVSRPTSKPTPKPTSKSTTKPTPTQKPVSRSTPKPTQKRKPERTLYPLPEDENDLAGSLEDFVGNE